MFTRVVTSHLRARGANGQISKPGKLEDSTGVLTGPVRSSGASGPEVPKFDFGTRTGPDRIPVSGILVPGRTGHRMSGFTVHGRTSTGPDSPE